MVVTQGIEYGTGFLILLCLAKHAKQVVCQEARHRIRHSLGSCRYQRRRLTVPDPNRAQHEQLSTYAVAILVLTGPALPLCRGRLPPRESQWGIKLDLALVKSPVFLALSFSRV